MTTSTKESKCCKWCEDSDALITLYSKSNDEILGFCSDACWSSYSEVLFNDRCPKCNEKANLLQIPASNKEDLFNEEFVNYCDNCFSKSVNSKLTNHTTTTKQSNTPKIEKPDKNSTSVSSTNNNNDSPNLNDSNSTANQSVKRSRTFKNSHQPYEIWGCFNWESYLLLEGSTPAPAECFKQNADPPTNEFELNMKLEAPDPRNPSSTCIATVVSVMGFRIELRLDGSDNTNDFWLTVDSEDIKPIGYTQEQGGMLQPPLGFRKSPSNWPVFVSNTLNNAVIAPKSCFKTPPVSPKKNLFKINHKLEAVDKKNPQLICPATITNIRDSMVFVSFDGWKGAFDYWTRFDSRDLFPVGWCERSQHPLQMPGNKDLKIDANKLSVNYIVNISYQTSKIKNSRTSMNNSALNSSKTSIGNLDSSSSQSNDSNVGKSTATSNSSTANNSATATPTNQTSSSTNQKSSTATTATIHTDLNEKINLISTVNKPPSKLEPVISLSTSNSKNQNSSPTQPQLTSSSLKALLLDKNKKLTTTTTTTKPQIAPQTAQTELPKRPVNGIISTNNKLIVNNNNKLPIAASSSLINNNSNHHPIATTNQPNKSDNNNNNTNKHPLVTVHLNLNCNPGEYINVQEFKRVTLLYNNKIGPSQLNKTMKDILQLIVNCCKGECRAYILEMIRPGNGSFEVETGFMENGQEKKMKLPHFNRASAFWNYLNNFLGGLKCCKNLVSMMPVECDLCTNNRSKESPLINNNLKAPQPAAIKAQQPSAIKSQQPSAIKAQQLSAIKPTINQSIIKQQQLINRPKVNHSTPINNKLINNNKPVTIVQKSTAPIATPKQTPPPTATTTTTTPTANNTPTTLKRKSEDQSLSAPKIVKTNGHHSPPESSTSEPQLSNPNDWSIDDVINFLKMNDKSLDFAELFKAHEIDGKAFLLLDSDMLMKYMKIKLGPSLKIASIIEQLKKDQNLLN